MRRHAYTLVRSVQLWRQEGLTSSRSFEVCRTAAHYAAVAVFLCKSTYHCVVPPRVASVLSARGKKSFADRNLIDRNLNEHHRYTVLREYFREFKARCATTPHSPRMSTAKDATVHRRTHTRSRQAHAYTQNIRSYVKAEIVCARESIHGTSRLTYTRCFPKIYRLI